MNRYKQIHKKTKNLSLLLVEDHESSRKELEDMLNDYFSTVVSCENGEEALHAYKNYFDSNQCYFDIVMSDIQMPIMNGIELTEALKDINKKQDIIILSAHQDGHYLVPLINLGASKFIDKPISYDLLLDMLEDVIDENPKKEEKEKKKFLNLGDDYIWDFEHSVAMRNQEIIHLTNMEYKIFKILIDSGIHICKTEYLINEVYAKNIEINHENLKNVISRMRKKFPMQLIETVYGSGYRLALP